MDEWRGHAIVLEPGAVAERGGDTKNRNDAAAATISNQTYKVNKMHTEPYMPPPPKKPPTPGIRSQAAHCPASP